MARKKIPVEKKSAAAKKKVAAAASEFDEWEDYFNSRKRSVFRFFIFIVLLFSLMLFNLRISEGSDDSSYIYAGFKYSQNFFNYFYTYNAPLWPIFLSLPIKLFGLNIPLLKMLSFIFYFFSFVYFFKAFQNRVPWLVLIPVLIFYSLNASLLYYSSQTYNEAFFLFFQSLFLFFFFRLAEEETDSFSSIKKNWKLWLACGSLIAILSLVKNLGIILFPAMALFFLVHKKWRFASAMVFFSLAARFVYEVAKQLIWGSRSQYATQSEMFLRKDPYIPSSGNDDIWGFFGRFFGNCSQYFSKRFLQILGFQDELPGTESGLFAFIIICLVIGGFIIAWKYRRHALAAAGFYTGSLVFASFFILQLMWDQSRLIVIHLPVVLLFIFFLFYTWLKRYKNGQVPYSAIIILFTSSVFISSVHRSAANIPVLKKNLSGDIYYGYTPDWANFLKMSRWCADSLPADAVVASRKAGMSFIYGKGKEFFPITKVLFYDPKTFQSKGDSAFQYFKNNKVHYFILANLRKYQWKSKEIINTVHCMLHPIALLHPDKVKIVHQEGRADDEPCYLFRLDF
jgi:hypothetical protein